MIPNMIMPSVTVPIDICPGIDDIDVNENISGVVSYEVTHKDEYGVELKVKNITLDKSPRIL
jgi:hypothetical protein